MTENEIIEVEEKIYVDLSPVVEASQKLHRKLPRDGRTLSDETWHFFHFETNDYVAVERTIRCACEIHGWKNPTLISMDELQKSIQTDKKGPGKSLDYEQVHRGIVSLLEKEKSPLFIYASYNTSKDDNSASKLSANRDWINIMESWILYCSNERMKQNEFQIYNDSAFLEKREVPYYNRLFFVSYGSSCILPDKFRTSLYTITYPSLTAEDFRCLLWEYHLRKERLLQMNREAHGLKGEIRELKLTDELLQWYANRMAGLEEILVRRLLSSMDDVFVTGNADYTDKETIDKVIVDYKNEILKQHGRLEVIHVKKSDEVIGLETMQKWVSEHKALIGSYDRSPTGILLVGIPGTGKSATAKDVANQLEYPLVRLDMSRILGGRVGDSEKGMREMLDDLQFVAPCVLWIDEIEKAMGGAGGTKSGDGGTITRLFGMLLTFIQENDRPVFTVTTANDISTLPPEFFRNGRFDQTFALMMPDYGGCREIMQLKLNKYAKELGWEHAFNLFEAGALLDQCVGSPQNPRFLTGADIEAHVKELFCKYGACKVKECPGLEHMKKMMKEIAETVRAQACPSASYTMEDIAKRYLDMIQRGMTMAGKSDGVYVSSNLNLDKVIYYSFDDDNEKKIPLCMEEPMNYINYKDVNNIADNTKASDWYNARFFYELVTSMSKVVFLDKDISMPETRSEYWKLMKYLNKNK